MLAETIVRNLPVGSVYWLYWEPHNRGGRGLEPELRQKVGETGERILLSDDGRAYPAEGESWDLSYDHQVGALVVEDEDEVAVLLALIELDPKAALARFPGVP